VRFTAAQMMCYVTTDDECIVRHQLKDLRVDPCWSAATRAELLYPGRYHSVHELRFDFDTRNPCMREGCAESAAKRCIINVWGCVVERDWCEAHSDIDGMMGESDPPVKKDYMPFTPIREPGARAAA